MRHVRGSTLLDREHRHARVHDVAPRVLASRIDIYFRHQQGSRYIWAAPNQRRKANLRSPASVVTSSGLRI